MKTYEIPVSEEIRNNLQRLSFEVDAAESVVERIITNPKYADDDTVLNSKPYKKFMHDLQLAKGEYEILKNTVSNEYFIPTVKEKENCTDVKFNWEIPDLSVGVAKITIFEIDGNPVE